MRHTAKKGWLFLCVSVFLSLLQWLAFLLLIFGYEGHFYKFFEFIFGNVLLNLIILSGFTYSCTIGVQSSNLKMTSTSIILFLSWSTIIYGLIWR